MELYKLTAHELHDKLVNKEVSSVELTKALYERIDAVEDKVNAYVTLDKENALAQAAKVDAKNADEFKDAKTVYIGRVYKFVPEIEPWSVIERLQDDADDDADEAAEDYLQYVSDDEANKLGKMLTETFNKWAKETNNEPGFFVVKDVVEYSLEEGGK